MNYLEEDLERMNQDEEVEEEEGVDEDMGEPTGMFIKEDLISPITHLKVHQVHLLPLPRLRHMDYDKSRDMTRTIVLN